MELKRLKGFRDFLPSDIRKRNFVLDIIKKTFEFYGFEPIETPALEYEELLLGKYGTQASKLIYSFKDKGGRNIALKYDQTVPTARFITMYKDIISMPFRRYQIQPVWRAENPQKGRFREFLQCDADIFGSSSALADAEVIALASQLFTNLGFENFKIYINDRKILFDLMKFANIPEELQFAVIAEIDKLDRKTEEEISFSLKKVGISDTSIKHLFHHLKEQEETPNLRRVIEIAKSLGVSKEKITFQARLARGLDYYTSTIFEIKIEGYTEGSVLGGGRYDKLIGDLGGVDIPAVGFGLGFDRTIEAMENLNLLPRRGGRQNVLVAIFSQDFIKHSTQVVNTLRSNKIAVEIFPDENSKLEKQLKYADKKGIRWFIVIGPDEAKTSKVILKDLSTGHQEDLNIESLVNTLKKST